MSITRFLVGLLAFEFISPGIVVALLALGMPVEVAGPIFVLMGVMMMAAMWGRAALRTSVLMVMTAMYVLSGGLLSLVHLDHWGSQFTQYKVLGVQASILHHGVEALYLLVIILTAVSAFKAYRADAAQGRAEASPG